MESLARFDRSTVEAELQPRETLLAHMGVVRRVIGYLAQRYGLSRDDVDDLTGWVLLRLLEDDCAVLRKFRGGSRLSTYLTTVVRNLFRDFLVQRWGRWRPSARARRLGELGVRLEALIYRDGFSRHEAVRIVFQRVGGSISLAELETAADRLRPRTSRRFETAVGVERLAGGERSDAAARSSWAREGVRRAERCLARAFRQLDRQDRVLLRMRFGQGMSVADIARTLGVAQRPLYTRVHRSLRVLRRSLESDGLAGEEVLSMLERVGGEIHLDFGLSGPTGRA